ncbi:hypothetical protein KKA02_01205 [Patescibacteria group bacterium]|nr:hypothetical protein [Patescibacteria group bacterium]MCG2702740.1 hypothetical protein [Candidatus Parcubacteria bacterium]MBU4209958.1 hypothetical protein [Patescibacteria group bacterium]MBU4265440.1 hypothetical protein [Patescibacteria group bacterium]MBU4390490.1 hypothetical protein [Patescibacteria group bacterium]
MLRQQQDRQITRITVVPSICRATGNPWPPRFSAQGVTGDGGARIIACGKRRPGTCTHPPGSAGPGSCTLDDGLTLVVPGRHFETAVELAL